MPKDIYVLEIQEKDGKKHSYSFSSLNIMRSFWHDTLQGNQHLTSSFYRNIAYCWTYKNGVYHSFSGF